jgi:anthranilate 1,2-dioxygenase ferredoxin subunit
MSEAWHPIVAEDDIPANGIHAAVVAGWHVLVARTDEGFRALNDRCTHQASPLSTGRVRRGVIMCPLHGARFELVSGKCLGSAYRDLRSFPLRIENGMIEVSLPATPPGPEDSPVILATS